MQAAQSEKVNYLTFVFPLIILSVFLIGYWTILHKMSIRWGGGDNSYCYLIVPLFAYLLWEQRGIKGEGRRTKEDGGQRTEGEGYADEGQMLKAEGRREGRRTMDEGRKKAVSSVVPQPSEAVVLHPSVQSSEGFQFGEFAWNVWGVVPVIFSILLIIIGELGSVETLLYAGIWGCVVGVTAILYGRRIRYLIFPLLILAFIVPLPPFINRMLTFQLKLAASKLSTAMLRVSGISVLREGNIIDLGISQLQVVDACSGLRYLMPLILTALLVGYFFNKRLWQRTILVLVVAPLSIFVNSFRIWITGMLTVKGHEKLAQSFFHDFSGWLIYIIAGAVLVAVALILRKIKIGIKDESQESEVGSQREERRTKEDGRGEIDERPVPSVVPHLSEAVILPPSVSNKPNPNHEVGWLKPTVITIVLCLLFAGSGWALKAIPSARNLPPRMSFDSFPMKIGHWQGDRHYISKEILDSLWADDYVSATYTRTGSQNYISLLIPFYEYQGTRHTAHAPQSCMLGGGWALFNSGERLINVSSGEDIKIMTMTWEKGSYKLLGSYFFLQRGRVITSPWMNKFYLMWDAFIKQRTDGALVRVEMTMAPGQSMDDAYAVLEEFTAKLWPILPDYVPN